MLKPLILVFFTTLQFQTSAQNTNFEITTEKIENLLRYKQKSPVQLRLLLQELKQYSKGNETRYNQIKSRVDLVLIPLDIKIARSDVYNKKYEDATRKLKEIKINYSFNSDIERLESYLDNKFFSFCKGKMLRHKPFWFSLEPSYSLYSSEVSIKNFNKAVNLNPVYGLGLYFRTKNRKKLSTLERTNYSYSQIGFKIDFRDTNYRFMKDTTFTGVLPYFNSQLSLIYRKTLGLDLGVISYSDKAAQAKTNYSLTTSFFIPMGYFSLGLNARLISDLKSTNPVFQVGGTFKLNLGLYRPFSFRDREEIKSQVLKFKEGL
ncbi:MAG: hypothetical protein ACKO7P_00670 [Bacteroidota bacterium]